VIESYQPASRLAAALLTKELDQDGGDGKQPREWRRWR
jgi:hypothetical protein